MARIYSNSEMLDAFKAVIKVHEQNNQEKIEIDVSDLKYLVELARIAVTHGKMENFPLMLR